MKYSNLLMGMSGRGGTAQKAMMPDGSACIESWLLDVPGWSPIWQHYMVSVVHLRESEIHGPPTKRWPGAEYEVVVQALDSEKLPLPTKPDTWVFLSPINVCWQFDVPQVHEADIERIVGAGGNEFDVLDDTAKQVVMHLTQLAVDGKLCMETGGITGSQEMWRAGITSITNGRTE